MQRLEVSGSIPNSSSLPIHVSFDFLKLSNHRQMTMCDLREEVMSSPVHLKITQGKPLNLFENKINEPETTINSNSFALLSHAPLHLWTPV